VAQRKVRQNPKFPRELLTDNGSVALSVIGWSARMPDDDHGRPDRPETRRAAPPGRWFVRSAVQPIPRRSPDFHGKCDRAQTISVQQWDGYDAHAPASTPGTRPPHTLGGTLNFAAPSHSRSTDASHPGQGARTDLTYLPDPAGKPVFINSTTVTIATLLHDLSAEGTTITKSALRQQGTQQSAGDNQSPSLPQPPNTPTTRQIKKSLNALNKLGAISYDRHYITVINNASSIES